MINSIIEQIIILFRATGTVVPLGKETETGIKNPNGYTLNYNGKSIHLVLQLKNALYLYLVRICLEKIVIVYLLFFL